MDFKAFSEKAKKIAQDATGKVKKFGEDALEKTAASFSKSGAFIRGDKDNTKEEKLKKLIEENKSVLVIFGKEESDFFKKSLLMFPIIFTKGWTKNFKLKIYPLDADESVEADFKVKSLPSLLIFKEGKISENIEGEENVMKIVKNLSLEVEGIAK